MAMSQAGKTLARNHIRFGWLMLAAFATIGVALEAFHGFKTDWYLEEAYETRRLLFTLGHAHGALLSIVNVLFGVAALATGGKASSLLLASRLLTIATVLLPSGFLIGGFGIRGTDPGIGIYLVPVGAVCAVAAFLALGIGAKQRRQANGARLPRK
ncbi:MAG: hypothetical protein OXN89_08210 [Bryobacterales bacterium]|nr:hypothetical protein [Bryobacterales bacterium]